MVDYVRTASCVYLEQGTDKLIMLTGPTFKAFRHEIPPHSNIRMLLLSSVPSVYIEAWQSNISGAAKLGFFHGNSSKYMLLDGSFLWLQDGVAEKMMHGYMLMKKEEIAYTFPYLKEPEVDALHRAERHRWIKLESTEKDDN
jgi:hypothetical protein